MHKRYLSILYILNTIQWLINNSEFYFKLKDYYGETCELNVNQCNRTVNPCNMGYCLPIQNGSSNYTCYCKSSFNGTFNRLTCLLFIYANKNDANTLEGTNCEHFVDLCANQPCKFGGICTQTTPIDYTCQWLSFKQMSRPYIKDC